MPKRTSAALLSWHHHWKVCMVSACRGGRLHQYPACRSARSK